MIELVGVHVAEEHADLLVRDAGERDAERAAHDAAAPVRPDEVARPDRPAADSGGHAVVVLLETGQLRTALDLDAELREPGGEQLLGAALREDPGVRVGHVRRRLLLLGHPALHGELAVEVGLDRRGQHRFFPYPAEDPQVFEDLEGARLQPVAPRAGERMRVAIDDPHIDVPARQLDGKRQPRRRWNDRT